MTSDAQVLLLAQWLSPSYPIGAFTYSHGLEWAVAAGDVADAAALRDWLADVLEHGAGRADATFLAAAFGTGDLPALRALDARARAFAPSAERLHETASQGCAFARAASAVWPDRAIPDLCYPLAVGHAARLHGLPLLLTARMFLHATASNLVSAAARLIPIGQTDAQKTVAFLAPLCEAVAEDAIEDDVEDIASTVFAADIASMRHETQVTRLFRT